MKFSENWLREWVNPDLDTAALAEQLTMAGLEVDAIEPLGESLEGVIVGEIVAAEQHPDADKLQVCQVSIGESDNLSIVCGAPNARQGIKVAVATVGSVLPGNFEIKPAKLRGVESFGMLCSGKELNLSDDSDGIIELADNAVVGSTLIEQLDLNDAIIDVDLTPNRGDCLGMRGIAREVGVLNQLDVNNPKIDAVAATCDDTFPIALNAPAACPRYVGRVLKNIDPDASTPIWMQQKLERSGIRSIDPVVDVTNYVLLELGHPMHAFDLEQLDGGIDVRMCEEGETLTLLDGQAVNLKPNTLLIADHSKPLAIAGVMGGEHSGISANTKHLFLESAFFEPVSIAGKAREYGLHTDASHRYERGVDSELQSLAMERATGLLLDIVGGEPGPLAIAEEKDQLPAARNLILRRKRVEKLVGMAFSDQQITDILTRLGLTLTPNDEGWEVLVPSFRFDIDNEESLVEEIVRIYGYNRLPQRRPRADMAMFMQPEKRLSKRRIRSTLVGMGYQEVITYSFIDPASRAMFAPEAETASLLNPISSEMAEMRTSLLPGLAQTAAYNLNRQQSTLQLCEIGLRFELENGSLTQTDTLAGLVCGATENDWHKQSRKLDFFDVKGHLQTLLKLVATEREVDFVPVQKSFLHPGQSASIIRRNKVIGYLGMLHPALVKKLDLASDTLIFEIDIAGLVDRGLPKFAELSRQPSIRRDLSLVVEESVPAAEIIKKIKKVGGKLLTGVKIFDIYTGDNVESGSKSIALGLTLRHPSQTLSEEEINQTVSKIVADLEKSFSAILRS